MRFRLGSGIMAVDERQRHMLHEKLDDVLGPDEAATLMEHLPPVGWADVARRSDVDHLAETLRAEFRSGLDGLRVEMHREFGGVRKEFGGVYKEFGEVRKEFGEVHKEIGGIRKEIVAGNRQMVFAIIASQFTAVSLAFAAMSLAG